MEKVVRNGRVAVLYSPGFGAGWTTWGAPEEAMFHPDLVAWVEGDKKGDLGAILKRLGWDFYAGGGDDLTIEWMPEGAVFRIDEYDGSESIVMSGDDSWITA